MANSKIDVTDVKPSIFKGEVFLQSGDCIGEISGASPLRSFQC